MAHDTLGTKEIGGIIRFSVGIFNTNEDIDKTIEVIKEISDNM